MRIVLLGAPGSGKGTQAALLVKELGLPHISTGELLRSAVKAGSALGLQAKGVMDRGELVSDEIMLGLIEERLSRPDIGGGFILDGYPRNLVQAEALDDLLNRLEQPVEEALQIDVDVEMVIARIAKRAAEEGRSDDTEETVRKRMEVYAAQTAPVVDYYAGKGVLSRVLGEGSIEEVFQRIKGVLQMRSEA
ncbi:MAG: adenylate kinase [Xanthomonadales bacterium]|jgi:adenylate kinase|nr:adenylate kinase [Xanthomonadales bacterium]MDH3923614.1 adenylate kinase [Xanthomonadales bacterium]MDH3939579.1 adenylate kinase [Xanthomonadales bacterium]MDH3999737.1 adenylate kinase [Xanthomonadales bacterium]